MAKIAVILHAEPGTHDSMGRAAHIFKEFKNSGLIEGACDFCIGAFGVDKEKVHEAKINFISEYMGHPSVAKLIKEGYQIITL